MITSKLMAGGRTTIPPPVRAALRLQAGDELLYTIEPERVVLTRAGAARLCDPFPVFDEWNSEVDRCAYAHLSAR